MNTIEFARMMTDVAIATCHKKVYPFVCLSAEQAEFKEQYEAPMTYTIRTIGKAKPSSLKRSFDNSVKLRAIRCANRSGVTAYRVLVDEAYALKQSFAWGMSYTQVIKDCAEFSWKQMYNYEMFTKQRIDRQALI